MYEHPFLDTVVLSELSLDDIHGKISELTSKLNFAYQTNNPALIGQIQMVLESYSQARTRKLNDMFPKDEDGGHDDKIDIS